MLCLQFPSQLKIPKWNCGLLIEVPTTIWAKGFHSPCQITCLREKVPSPYAMCPIRGVDPESSRWWLSRVNVHLNRILVSVAFAVSTLWKYQYLMERTGVVYFLLSHFSASRYINIWKYYSFSLRHVTLISSLDSALNLHSFKSDPSL